MSELSPAAETVLGALDASDPVDARLVQRLLAASVRAYARTLEEEGPLAPFPEDAPSPTAAEVCLATTQMLDAVSVEIFELALWKSWAHGAPPGDVE